MRPLKFHNFLLVRTCYALLEGVNIFNLDVVVGSRTVLNRILMCRELSDVFLGRDVVLPIEATEFTLPLEHKEYTVRVTEDGSLELWLDHCLRKRDATEDPVLYVWTNIELYWEEHRWVEARLHRGSNKLHITVDGETVLKQTIATRRT